MNTAASTRAITMGATLWALVATLLARFTEACGDLHGLDARARCQAAAWLRDLEALARRLLFADAAKRAAGRAFKPYPPRPAGARPPARSAALRNPVFRILLGATGASGVTGTPGVRFATYPAVSLARRAQALALLLASPAPHAQKLARRIARRRDLVPAMIVALRRHRPHRRLRRVLAPLFAERPETLVSLMERPPPRDGPYAVTLPPDLGRPLTLEPRTTARRTRAPAGSSRQATPGVGARAHRTSRTVGDD